MKFFRREKRASPSLSELQGVPEGTFRCDVCKHIQPLICIGGGVIDAPIEVIHRTESALRDNPPKSYTLCNTCAIWLGFEEFPSSTQGPPSFSDEQREKIRSLQRELDIAYMQFERAAKITDPVGPTNEDFERLHQFLESVPNYREWVRLDAAELPLDIIDLRRRLTNDEAVDLSEIKKANKG